MKDQLALVKNVYNEVVFLFDKKRAETAGIFLENSNNCYVVNKYNYSNISRRGKFNNEKLEE